jgi:hypothetical protein
LFQEIPALAYQWVARRGFSFGPAIAAVAQLILQRVGGRHRITGSGIDRNFHRKFHRTHCSDAKGRPCCEAHGGTAVNESRRAIGLRKGERNQAEEIEYLAAFGNALGFSTIEKLHGVSTVDKVYKTINGDAQVLRFL